MKQTAVEWLFKQLWEEPKDKFTWHSILEQAKEMEKEQILEFTRNAVRKILDEDRTNPFNLEQYYNETYGSKDIALQNQLESKVITELSDEEITKLANEHILYNNSKRQWVIEGMKLYRIQLKLKQ